MTIETPRLTHLFIYRQTLPLLNDVGVSIKYVLRRKDNLDVHSEFDQHLPRWLIPFGVKR